MQQKKLNSYFSISFGTKGQKLKAADIVTISHSPHKILYSVVMLVMVMVASLSITGCEQNEETTVIPSVIPKVPAAPDSTYVVPTVPAAEITASDALALIFVCLRIPASKSEGDLTPSDVIKEGTVIEYNYHDELFNVDCKLKINPELTTKDALVLQGTTHNTKTGGHGYIRNTYTKTDGGIIMKQQWPQDGLPPSEKTVWVDSGTEKNIPAPDGVKKYNISTSGNETYSCKIVPKTETSVTEIGASGGSCDLTNIKLVKYHRVNTGLPNVHM